MRLGSREGAFVPERDEVRLKLRSVPAARSVLVEGEERGPVGEEDDALTVSLGEDAGSTTVEVIL